MDTNHYQLIQNNYLFSAPYKTGFASNGIFDILAVTFARISTNSVSLLVKVAGISIKTREILAQ